MGQTATSSPLGAYHRPNFPRSCFPERKELRITGRQLRDEQAPGTSSRDLLGYREPLYKVLWRSYWSGAVGRGRRHLLSYRGRQVKKGLRPASRVGNSGSRNVAGYRIKVIKGLPVFSAGAFPVSKALES